MIPKIIDNTFINSTYKDFPDDFVQREDILTGINAKVVKNDIIILEGESGVGKTSFLQYFAKLNGFNSISHFFNESQRITFSPEYFIDNLYRQIYFLIHKKEVDENLSINDSLLALELGTLARYSNKSNETIYFIFDGIDDLKKGDIELLSPIFKNLYTGRVKFLFSKNENLDLLNLLIPTTLKIKQSIIPLFKFTNTLIKEYFKELEISEDDIKEIWKISKEGLPERLFHIKRIIANSKMPIKETIESLDENSDLIAQDWELVDESDEILLQIIALLVFDDNQYSLTDIESIFKIKKEDILLKISTVVFININKDVLNLISNNHKKYAQGKLKSLKNEIQNKMIDYFESNVQDVKNIFNLTNLYTTAKKWEKLTNLLTFDSLVMLIEKNNSLNSVNKYFDSGITASKNLLDEKKYYGDFLRFAIHKSSILELDRYSLWSAEIEARLELSNYQDFITLVNSIYIKEDKLKFLALLAKVRHDKKLDKDINLNKQIEELYNQIDTSQFQENAITIAGLLMYSNFELALDLIEKSTNNSLENNSIDAAYAYLSFLSINAGKDTSNNTEIDLIENKIKNEEIKILTKGLRYIASDHSYESILKEVDKIDNTNRKLFLLRSWIFNNKEKEGVEKVIEFTINEIINVSTDKAPNSKALYEICTPLPLLKDKETALKLISLFDTQRVIINKPTFEYIKQQLIISETIYNFDIEKGKERILETFIYIDNDIKDKLIKTNCLILLWKLFNKIDIDGEIEKLLFSPNSLKEVIVISLKEILSVTAYHFKVVRYFISVFSKKDIDIVIEIINLVNVEERREQAMRLAIKKYIIQNNISDINFNKLEELYKLSKQSETKVILIKTLIEKHENISVDDEIGISKLLSYSKLFFSIDDLDSQFFILIGFVKILTKFELKYNSLIKKSILAIWNIWNEISEPWVKIEKGFVISKELANIDLDTSNRVIDETIKLKENVVFSSKSIVSSYMLSLKLLLRCFNGILNFKSDMESEINKFEELTVIISSETDQLYIWNEFLLILLNHKKKDLFESYCKSRFIPILDNYTNNDVNLYHVIFQTISPTIYHYSNNIFWEKIQNFPVIVKDKCILNVCEYIITSYLPDEPHERMTCGYELEYKSYRCLIELLGKMDGDYLFYNIFGKIVDNIKINKNRNLSTEQISILYNNLNELIQNQLPNKLTGIKHDGYKIASLADLYKIKNNIKKEDWEKLIDETNLIQNDSDKALVLTSIASNSSFKNINIQCLDSAHSIISKLPINYEIENRFNFNLETWYQIDKSKFAKYWKDAYIKLIEDKDGNIDSLKNLIDLAQQHDPKLAEYAVSQLDNEPSRMRLKEPVSKRIELNKKLKNAQDDNSKIEQLERKHYSALFEKSLAKLNSGKIAFKEIKNTLTILEKLSSASLSESYDGYCYFIQNAIEKIKLQGNNTDILISIYSALYENCRLVATLSTDNIQKMKLLFKLAEKSGESTHTVFNSGERNIALDYISSWINNNTKLKLLIVDPYFSELDLSILSLIKNIDSNISIQILTSKESSKNCNENNPKTYFEAWRNISEENPPNTKIKVAWLDKTKKSPFHDRYIISDDGESGLRIGTSISSIGISKTSEISEITEAEMDNIKRKIILDYIVNEIPEINGNRIRYSSFELIDDY